MCEYNDSEIINMYSFAYSSQSNQYRIFIQRESLKFCDLVLRRMQQFSGRVKICPETISNVRNFSEHLGHKLRILIKNTDVPKTNFGKVRYCVLLKWTHVCCHNIDWVNRFRQEWQRSPLNYTFLNYCNYGIYIH